MLSLFGLSSALITARAPRRRSLVRQTDIGLLHRSLPREHQRVMFQTSRQEERCYADEIIPRGVYTHKLGLPIFPQKFIFQEAIRPLEKLRAPQHESKEKLARSSLALESITDKSNPSNRKIPLGTRRGVTPSGFFRSSSDFRLISLIQPAPARCRRLRPRALDDFRCVLCGRGGGGGERSSGRGVAGVD